MTRISPFASLFLLASLAPLQATPDLCAVRGIESESLYGASRRIEWSDPLNQAALELRLNGERIEPGAVVQDDGEYLLEIFGTGPKLEPLVCPPISFTLDTTPPRLRFYRPEWLPAGAAPRLEVTEAHPAARKPEFYLNGEPYDPATPPPPGEYELEAVVYDQAGHRASLTTPYEVYPWCEPTSWVQYQPATARLSAAHYFPWYTATASCPANNPWCNCFWGPKPQNPQPARGFYGSSDQATVNAQLAQMAAHGIDIVSLEWTGDGYQESNLLNKVIPRVGAYGMKFVVFYDTGVRLTPGSFTGKIDFNLASVRNKFIADFQKFASSTKYFKHPSYLKFNNQPVIYLWISRAIVGSEANIRAAFNAAQQAARSAGFSGLYLVADHLFWGNPDATPLFWMGAKAVTSFAPIDNAQGIAQGSAGRPIRLWANKMAGLYANTLQRFSGLNQPVVDLQPGIFIQVDQRGLELPICFSIPTTSHYHLVDGSDFSYMIDVAGKGFTKVAELHVLNRRCNERVLTNGTTGTSIVWTYSYNEWFEGAGLEELAPRNPPYPYGFGLAPLQILKQKLP